MSTKIKKNKPRQFDQAFKMEILRMVDTGRPIAEIADSMGINDGNIYHWKKQRETKGMYRSGPGTPPGQPAVEEAVPAANITRSYPTNRLAPTKVIELRRENEELKAKVALLTEQNGILKKAFSIFSQTA